MDNICKILINKENASDNSYTLVSLTVKSGAKVERGSTIAIIESSKASIDIEAPQSGFIYLNNSYLPGMSLSVGSLIAIISETERDVSGFFNEESRKLSTSSSTAEERISKPALDLIQKHHINPDSFKHLPLVKAKDVEDYIAKNSGPTILSNLKFSKNSIAIYGGGGHAKMCIDVIRQGGKYALAGIIDRSLPVGSEILGVPVISNDSDINLEKLLGMGLTMVVNGVGSVTNPGLREKIYGRLNSLGFHIPTIIHPKAIVEPSVKIGGGCQIMMGASVGSAVVIAENSIVNSGAIVSHDCILEDNVHIAPGAILAGGIKIGRSTVVGMGVTVYLGIKIGQNCIIPNGEDVFKDIPDNYRGASKAKVANE